MRTLKFAGGCAMHAPRNSAKNQKKGGDLRCRPPNDALRRVLWSPGLARGPVVQNQASTCRPMLLPLVEPATPVVL